jgi:hypothetical protein
MGYDYPAELKGIRGNPCVSIWDELMSLCESRYIGAPPQRAFEMPDGVTAAEFCPLSGRISTEYCTDPLYGQPLERGWFAAGTEPKSPCDFHREPPIRIIPADPRDPDRIPTLPNDVLPAPEDTPPIILPERPWYSRFFSRDGARKHRYEFRIIPPPHA